jgi:hypothetical protein
VDRARAQGRPVLDLCKLQTYANDGVAGGDTKEENVMTVAVVVIIYIVFCILTGLCGSQRRMGFFGTFILSLFITPIVMLILLKLTAPSERVEWRQRSQGD